MSVTVSRLQHPPCVFFFVVVKMCLSTLVVVLRQVSLVDVEVVVGVQLPELAVDDIEMLIGEEFCQLVHIFFLLQQCHILPFQKNNTDLFFILILNKTLNK